MAARSDRLNASPNQNGSPANDGASCAIEPLAGRCGPGPVARRPETVASPDPLPIGVVIPTLNCRDSVSAHIEQVNSWAARVREIVVVDSHSADGTFDALRSGIRHPSAKFLQHPPGLYPSWNHGIAQLASKYAYLATVGDTISATGLEHLYRTAEKFSADVVISRPRFADVAGRALSDYRWPLHQLLSAFPVSHPIALAGWQVFILNTIDAPQTLMGSSASNLYRTETVQRWPFSSEYGHAGDSAWGISHAFDTVFAITPEVFSTFILHANAHAGMPEEKYRSLLDKLLALARETAARASRTEGLAHLLPALCDFLEARREVMNRQLAYYRARKERFPWFANLRAWRARAARNRARALARSFSRGVVSRLPSVVAVGGADPGIVEYLKSRLAHV